MCLILVGALWAVRLRVSDVPPRREYHRKYSERGCVQQVSNAAALLRNGKLNPRLLGTRVRAVLLRINLGYAYPIVQEQETGEPCTSAVQTNMEPPPRHRR